MNFILNEYHRNIPDKDLIDDLKLVASKNNLSYVSRATYEKNGKYSTTPFILRYGTWINALMQAGLSINREEKDYKKISDNELICDIKKVADSMGCASISSKMYCEKGNYSVQTILYRFGTWDNALKKAKLESTGYKVISDEDLFFEIERLWIKKGSQPTSEDIKNGKSKYSLNTYSRRFGGWRKALETFVRYIDVENDKNILLKNQRCVVKDNDECNEEESKKILVANKRRTPRDINFRLRFSVLKRDNFKCCACGASPAKDPAVELHVDHIKPWSKGGETVLDNLQTLCSKCNLGKSDII